MCELHDPLDNLGDLEAAGVELDRVVGDPEGPVLAFAVARVALGLGGQNVGDVLAALRGATPSTLALARREEHLQLRVRGDDRPDVAALSDVAPGVDQLSLADNQSLADLRVDGHSRGGLGDLGAADLQRDVLPVKRDGAVGKVDPSRAGQRADGARVVGVAAGTQRGQRDRPVHRPGIEVREAEALGERPRNRGFAGPGGAVDGDDHAPEDRVEGEIDPEDRCAPGTSRTSTSSLTARRYSIPRTRGGPSCCSCPPARSFRSTRSTSAPGWWFSQARSRSWPTATASPAEPICWASSTPPSATSPARPRAADCCWCCPPGRATATRRNPKPPSRGSDPLEGCRHGTRA